MANAALDVSVPSNYRKGARRTWHQRRRHAAILRLLKHTSGRTLDYGCGYGDVAFQASKTHDVEGVDVDEARVAFAAAEYAPLPFRVCDPSRLDYDDETFDVVLSCVVVHFVPDPLRYLREAYRVLKPEGQLLIACKNVPQVRNGFRQLLGKGRFRSDLWIRDEHDVKDLLASEGFEVERRTHFYDPPVSNCKNAADLVMSCIEQMLSIARVHATCGYFVLLARKASCSHTS